MALQLSQLDTPPPEFRNYCAIAVECDAQGRESKLSVSFQYRDRATGKVYTYGNSYDLQPLVNAIARGLSRYHRKLHGHDDTSVSGWGDIFHKAKDLAKRAAAASGLKKAWEIHRDVFKSQFMAGLHQVSTKYLGPNGPKLIDDFKHAAIKAYHGDKDSWGKLVEIVQQAKEGNDKAKALIALSAQSSPSASTTTTSGDLGLDDEFLDYHNIEISGGPVVRDHRGAGAQRPIIRAPGPMMAFAPMVRPVPYRAAPPPPAPSDGGGGDDGGDDDDGYDDDDGSDTDVSGWLYNRGYRSPLAAMTGGFPGVGLAMRSLYSDGMDRIKAGLPKAHH